MGPTTYALCQQSVIAPVMWFMSLCAFLLFISDAPLSIATAGSTRSMRFSVPVDKPYAFDLQFEFSSAEARIQDQIVGSRYDEYCRGDLEYKDIAESPRDGLGRHIPIRVAVRRKSDNAVQVDLTFSPFCTVGSVNSRKSRTIGWVNLTRGGYIAEVINLKEQAGLESVRTSVSLLAGYGK